MSSLSLIEINNRINRLQEIGVMMGFQTSVGKDCLVWKSNTVGEYKLKPYTVVKEIDTDDTESIAVCVADEKVDCNAAKQTSLVEIEKLASLMQADNSQKERILQYWKLLYGHLDLSELLESFERPENNAVEKKTSLKKGKTDHLEKQGRKNSKSVVAYDMNFFEKEIGKALAKQLEPSGRKFFCDDINDVCVLELVSKVYPRAKGISEYWYSIHQYQVNEIRKHLRGYYAFCMSVANKVLLIDGKTMDTLLDNLTTSPNKGDMYWHIKIHTNGDKFWLLSKQGKIEVDGKRNGLRIIPSESIKNEDVLHIRKDNNRELQLRKKK